MSVININIPVISYAIGGVLYFLLALLLIFAWRGRGLLVLLAVSFNAVWAFFLAYTVFSSGFNFLSGYWFEVIRCGFWLFLSATLLTGGWRIERMISGWPLVICVSLLVSVLFGFWVDESVTGVLPVWPLISLLMLNLFGFALIEQFYRNAPTDKRWAIKFLCLSIGGLFVYDFYMYAHGLLFRQVDALIWTARGAVNALVVPLIAIAIVRNPQWDLRIYVSRHVIFYSTSIVAAGAYLMVMSLGGYYIRAYGGGWGEFLRLVLLYGSVLLFIVLVLSAQLRSRIKFFVGEHFFSNKYDYRREWLRLIDVMERVDLGLSLQQRAIKAVAQIVQAQAGVMWFQYGRNHFVPVASWNHDKPGDLVLSNQSGIVEHLLQHQKVVDFSGDAGQVVSIDVKAWAGGLENVWLVIPLMHEHALIGFIVLARADFSPSFTWEDEDLLKTVGQQLSSYLLQNEAASRLAEAQQFDAYNQLTAFIIHDLKNLISQLALLVQNAATHKNNPAFIEDAIETIDNAVGYMGRLIEQLKSGEAVKNTNTVDVGALLKSVISECSNRKPVPRLQELDSALMLSVNHERLAMMIKHLIHNAQDATDDDGFVRISYAVENGNVRITVEDNGVGMDKDFIDHRLFKPFDSTKGAKGMGIGAYEVKEFVRNSGGEIFVKSYPGGGASFTLLLPIHA